VIGEARLQARPEGLVAVTEGWFAVNVRDAAWVTNDAFGSACIFEGDDAPFADLGYTLAVLRPGQPSALYHREEEQEDFLVLSGECLLVIESEERPLRAGDFVHCPAWTEHIFVGAGDGPCAIFMAGGRTRGRGRVYPRNDVALRHGAGVEADTPESTVAYEPFPRWRPGAPEAVRTLPFG
jgi:uncharacterized cupin superfamily protein